METGCLCSRALVSRKLFPAREVVQAGVWGGLLRVLVYTPLSSLTSITAAHGLGAGKGGLKASLHLGFCQDVAVLLMGNKIKTPPRCVGQCVSGALGVGKRWVVGAYSRLRGMCGRRGGCQLGLDSLKTFLRLGTQLQIEKFLPSSLLSAQSQLAV